MGERDGGDAAEWRCASGASDRGRPTETAFWIFFGAEGAEEDGPCTGARTGDGDVVAGDRAVVAGDGGETEGEGAGAIAIGAAQDPGALGGEKLGSEEVGAVFDCA
jgi:hypothetical protein